MHPRERLAYSPIEGRAPLRFPDGVRLVLWPVLALEEWDISRPMARMVISSSGPLLASSTLMVSCEVFSANFGCASPMVRRTTFA